MNLCPVKAIKAYAATGAKIINYDRCLGCKMCMIAFPFGAISVDPLNKKVVKNVTCVLEIRHAQDFALQTRLNISQPISTA
jgi:Fe-S-cluster-containing dehydrogenase component